MKFLAATLFAALIAAIVVFAVGRFFPRSIGKSILQRLLWSHRINYRRIPDACLEALASDALQYAEAVSAASGLRDPFRRQRFIEYNRMLRIHAFVIAALCGGLRGSEITEFARAQTRPVLEAALVKGESVERAWARARRTAGGQFMDDAYAVAARGRGAGPSVSAGPVAARSAVDDGTAWRFQEQLLAQFRSG